MDLAKRRSNSRLPDLDRGPARKEIVFVDLTCADYDQFLWAAEGKNTRMIVLDTGRDVIEQMAGYLDRVRGVDAIHLISHGTKDNLVLGGLPCTAERLDRYGSEFERIGRALQDGGDIVLHGCDVGAGSAGARFIDRVAAMALAGAAKPNDARAATPRGEWNPVAALLAIFRGAAGGGNAGALKRPALG
jgi:hypothetical protein